MDEKTSTCYALKSIAYEPLIKCYTVWLGLKLAANQEKCQLVPCNNTVYQFVGENIRELLQTCLRFDTTFLHGQLIIILLAYDPFFANLCWTSRLKASHAEEVQTFLNPPNTVNRKIFVVEKFS